jgi:hypothetical protein
MKDIKVTVDDRAFSASLRRYALAMKMSFAEAILRQARLVAVNLAHQTQPFGSGAEARKQGEGAVTTEIGRVYDDVPQVAGRVKNSDGSFDLPRVKSAPQAEAAFVRLVRTGQHDKARELLNSLRIEPYFTTDVGRFDGGQEHARSRHGARRKVPSNTFTKLAVTNPQAARSYVKQISQRVGTAKAGWASCAQQLGGWRGIPGWVTRHARKGNLGNVYDATGGSGSSQYVRMTNNVPWIDKCLNPGQIQRALDIQRGKMTNAIRIALSKSR